MIGENVRTRYAEALLVAAYFAAASVPAKAVTVNSLTQLRSLGAGIVSNTTVTLSPTGGNPHPVTGIVTPGEYWLDGEHLDTSNGPVEPIFMDLSGSGNTYDLSGATIKVDTREFAGYGRALGHSSGVHLVQLTGNNNLLQGLTLIGEDLELDTDPNAQRYADWGTQYGKLTGDNNTIDGATIVARGSRTDTYGLSDAFGKGASQGMQPYIGHRKAAGLVVDNANNSLVNNLDLTVETFGHGFFTGSEVSNTTLSNSTITGELFPSQGVIDRPEYQQYGHTWWGYPIQDDIMLSGAEGGVRTYGGTNFTVDNVVVDGMRTGFATVATGGDVNISNSYAYNTTSGFDVGDNTTITGSGGNIVNGPLLVFYGSGNNTDIDLELTAGTPIGVNWSAAYFNGNADISIRSDLASEDLPEESYIRLGQRYFENWRDSDFNTATPDSNNPREFNDQTFVNDTNQILVFGENAVGNVGRSQGGVISNGKENYYDGVTYVKSGSRLEVEHTKGLGNSGTELGSEFSGNNIIYTGTATAATFDDNGTIVKDGGTLELAPGVSVVDEKLTITGDGVDGNGALYTAGQAGNAPRFGDSSRGNESTIFLDGDAAIGIGNEGTEMLVGKIQGAGNLTKRGAGKLAIEQSSTLAGDLIVAGGSVVARSGVVNHGLTVVAGASIAGLGNNSFNSPDGDVFIDGSIDLNSRTDDNTLSGTVGKLNGTGTVISSNPFSGAGGILVVAGDNGSADFSGAISTNINIVKSGDSTQTLSGSNTYSGTTNITAGTLLVDGTHTGGDSYTVAGGILGGSGSIDADITVESGGTLSPGASAGQLTVEHIVFETGSIFEIEIGGFTAGTEYDQLLADAATLSGDLSVSLLDLFIPYPSDTFSILDATSLSGMFDNVANGARLDTSGGEGSFLVTFDSTSDAILLSDFALSASPGDFNGDGQVDGLDFLEWQRNPGIGYLTEWEANYGSPSTALALAVPEPTTPVLCLVASAIGASRRRR